MFCIGIDTGGVMAGLAGPAGPGRRELPARTARSGRGAVIGASAVPERAGARAGSGCRDVAGAGALRQSRRDLGGGGDRAAGGGGRVAGRVTGRA